MRCFLLVLGLLGCWTVSSSAEEKVVEYTTVEARGKLEIIGDGTELLGQGVAGFPARVARNNLSFGDNKELLAQAKKLDGQTVLIRGSLGVWSPLTAGPPKEFHPYIHVTSIRAADADQEDAVSAEARAELLKGLTVTGTLTKVIGNFGTPGIPEAGDAFELELDKLPQLMLKFQTPDERTRAHYMPFPRPLKVESMKQAKKGSGSGRAAIHMSAGDGDRRVLIQVIAESLQPGSKARICLYENGGFIGSMAEAEGVLK